LLGIYEFTKALEPYASWHNTHPLVGTFYGDNQFGAFEAAVAVLGAALALSRDRLLRPLGAAAAVTGGIGCMLSLSLASTVIMTMAVGVLVFAAVVADRRTRRTRTAMLGAIGTVVVGSSLALKALVGPPPSGAKATWLPRYGDAKLTLDKWDDVRARLHYWDVAWHDFLSAPWSGHGHGWFGLHFGQTMHAGEYFSRWTHNGILQALADGGLLFGLPVAAAAGALLWVATRRLMRARRLVDDDPLLLGAALAVLVLVLHAQFDFDWNYPVLAGLLGLVGGIVAARQPAGAMHHERRRGVRAGFLQPR
jgi:O-antigen ligase